VAYVADQNDPNAQQPATTTPGAAMQQLPTTSSGAGAGATGTNTTPAGSPQGAAAVPNTTQAPPVQDLQAYLTANQPQAVQMGQNIAGNLQNTATQVTGDIAADQAAADANVQASNVQPNSQLITEAVANPTQFVQDPNNVSAFQALENANYTGPATYESTPQYQAAQAEVQNAENTAPNINTNAGVEQLVAGQETNPTLGMENLDQLLLQGTPAAMAPIAAAEQPVQALPTTLVNETTAEDQAIQQAIANDMVAPQAVNAAFLTGPNAVVPAFETNLQNELANEQAGINTYNTGLNNLLQEQIGTWNPSMGQAITNYENASGFTIPTTIGGYANDLIGTPQGAATMATTATPEDYETEAALAQLLGSNFTNQPLSAANAGEAGTAFNTAENPAVNPNALTQGISNDAFAALEQWMQENPQIFGAAQMPKVNAFNTLYDYLGTYNPNLTIGNQG
jgi:hypothetical protein